MTKFPEPLVVKDPPVPEQQAPLRVLVAEDNPAVQKTMVQMLTCLRHQVQGVSNGIEVLDALQDQRFDVVLMDVQMPLMNGLQTAQRIRQSLPPHCQPHIVAMTGRTSDEEQQECVDAGMDFCLTKPIPMQVLVNTLKQLPPLTHPSQVANFETSVDAIAEDALYAILDREVLAEIRTVAGESANSFLASTIDDYLEEAPKLLHTIQGAIAQQSISQLIEAAHSLGIMSAFLGALRFSRQCSQLENLGKSKVPLSSQTFTHALETFEAESLQVKQALWLLRQQAVHEFRMENHAL